MPVALVTGASSGIGATYAHRLAARGYDLVLVARRTVRLNEVADKVRRDHGVSAELMAADLTDGAQIEQVAQRFQSGAPIDLFVNNAGASLPGGFVNANVAAMYKLLRLNVLAPTMLAHAAIVPMVRRGGGAIVNIASVAAFVPDYFPGIYAATKSYVLTLSQGLSAEVGKKGVYVQAVLPAATRTEIWERSGTDVSKVPGLMEVQDLVDAALVGFDRRETVTIPAVPDVAAWNAFEQARGVLASGFGNSKPAARYLA